MEAAAGRRSAPARRRRSVIVVSNQERVGKAMELVAKLGSKAEIARELAYRLYTLCERKKRTAEALSYNALVQSWPEILRLSHAAGAAEPVQTIMFGEE